MATSLLLLVVSTTWPNLFDSAISSVPRQRACRFSSVVSIGVPAKQRGQSGFKRLHLGGNFNHIVAHAQAIGHGLGIFPADVGRVGRGHHHRAHALRAQGIDGNGQHQGRINAARQAQQHAGKAVFFHVIAHRLHQGLPQNTEWLRHWI